MAKNTKDDLSFMNVMSLNSASLANSPKSRKKIDYTLLVPNKESHYSMHDISELASGIEMVGLIHDLYVKPIPDSDKYVIISGHRRHAAIKMLVEEQGKDEYREQYCQVAGLDEDDTISKIKIHIANMQREKTEHDKMVAVQRLEELIHEAKEKGIKIKGTVRDLVAAQLGIGKSQVQTYSTVAKKATEKTKEALKQGEITLTQAYEQTQKSKTKKVPVTGTKEERVNLIFRKFEALKKEIEKYDDDYPDVKLSAMIDTWNEKLNKHFK